MSFTGLEGAAHGTFVPDPAAPQYSPNPGFVGWDGITYIVSDGRVHTATRVTFRVGSPLDDAPRCPVDGTRSRAGSGDDEEE